MGYHCVQYTRHHLMSLTLLAPFHTEFAYLSMLFILDMVCTAISGRNHATNAIFGSLDGAWDTEHNGTTFETVSQILME